MKKVMTLVMAVILVLALSSCTSSDYNKAVDLKTKGEYSQALEIFDKISDYKDAAKKAAECKAIIAAEAAIQARNEQLDAAVAEAEKLIAAGEAALNETAKPTLETAISTAKSEKKTMPATVSDMAVIDDLANVDYSAVLSELNEKKTALENSINQYKLVDSPNEAYVIKCLQQVKNVKDISAVTEDNDPNGNLNKAGGYTAQIYFSSDLINQSDVYGDTVIDKGTDCGGSIEVYQNAADANKRNEYLAGFDGSVISSGSHSVIGSVLIRTSDKLTASQQKALEADIITALTTLN